MKRSKNDPMASFSTLSTISNVKNLNSTLLSFFFNIHHNPFLLTSTTMIVSNSSHFNRTIMEEVTAEVVVTVEVQVEHPEDPKTIATMTMRQRRWSSHHIMLEEINKVRRAVEKQTMHNIRGPHKLGNNLAESLEKNKRHNDKDELWSGM